MSTVPKSETRGGATAKTILLVEDNLSARMALETLLDALGYRVLPAGDAAEAEKVFTQHAQEIDLLVSDLLLPGVNGTELYERLKQQKPPLRCVLMSGYPLEEESERLHALGIRHWIQKPFGMESMQAILSSALEE